MLMLAFSAPTLATALMVPLIVSEVKLTSPCERIAKLPAHCIEKRSVFPV